MGIDPVPVGFSSLPEPGPILRSQFVQDLRQAIFKFGPRGIDCGLIEPGRAFFAPDQAPRNFYRLGYSSISPAKIPEGIARIGRAIRTA